MALKRAEWKKMIHPLIREVGHKGCVVVVLSGALLVCPMHIMISGLLVLIHD